jgi:hypothetical protein
MAFDDPNDLDLIREVAKQDDIALFRHRSNVRAQLGPCGSENAGQAGEAPTAIAQLGDEVTSDRQIPAITGYVARDVGKVSLGCRSEYKPPHPQ